MCGHVRLCQIHKKQNINHENKKEQNNTLTPHNQPFKTKHATQQSTKQHLYISNNSPLFLVHFLFLCNLHPFSESAVFCCKHFKIMFSAKHSASASQIVTPLFYTHSNNLLFGRGELTQIHTFTSFCNCFGFFKPPKFPKWAKQLCAPKIPFFEIIKNS